MYLSEFMAICCPTWLPFVSACRPLRCFSFPIILSGFPGISLGKAYELLIGKLRNTFFIKAIVA